MIRCVCRQGDPPLMGPRRQDGAVGQRSIYDFSWSSSTSAKYFWGLCQPATVKTESSYFCDWPKAFYYTTGLPHHNLHVMRARPVGTHGMSRREKSSSRQKPWSSTGHHPMIPYATPQPSSSSFSAAAQQTDTPVN